MKISEDVTDFIGVYENALPRELCESLISNADDLINLEGITRYEQTVNDKHMIDDTATTIMTHMAPFRELGGIPGLVEAHDIMQECTMRYLDHFPVFNNELQSYHMKFQRTEPSQGYHAWHSENSSPQYRGRDLVWTIYLNTVQEGGETEFLYQRKRVPAKQGSVCIFPAAFTHTHRGNPPLSGVKYICTGWWVTVEV